MRKGFIRHLMHEIWASEKAACEALRWACFAAMVAVLAFSVKSHKSGVANESGSVIYLGFPSEGKTYR